jgi:hypothetical protein
MYQQSSLYILSACKWWTIRFLAVCHALLLTLGWPEQGMEWLLKMYLEGECSDYRFTYDAYAPAASQLISSLRAASSPEPSSAESANGENNTDADEEGSVNGVPDASRPALQPVRSQVTHDLLLQAFVGQGSAGSLHPLA